MGTGHGSHPTNPLTIKGKWQDFKWLQHHVQVPYVQMLVAVSCANDAGPELLICTIQVDGYEALVFYHKPVLEAVAILAQNEGPLNEVVPVFGVDVMFNLGCYLCGQFCVKEHRLCEEPTLPVVYFVCLTEKKQVHEGILEALVTAVPLLKQLETEQPTLMPRQCI